MLFHSLLVKSMNLPFVLAKRFVAGEEFGQAITAVRDLNSRGIAVSLDLLGENVKNRSLADKTLVDYQNLIKGIADEGLNSSISIKLTMMGLDINADYTLDNLFKLLETARSNNIFVRIDMEGSDYTDLTVRQFKAAQAVYGSNVGLVLQAYLHRTKTDIEQLADLGADIRICKGAYSEPARLAVQKMDDIRDAYINYATTLLHKTDFPRIATHDDQLIDWTKSYTAQEGMGKERFEFQMLYGLRQPTCEKLVEDGYNVRVYVPYGTMWFPYFSRRLRERKENIFFVLSAMFKN
jgi:proline dehydrogenase